VLRTYVDSDQTATTLAFPKKTLSKGTSAKTVAKRTGGLRDWLAAVVERCRQNEAIALNEQRAGLSLGGSIVLTAAVAQFLEPVDGGVDLAEIGLVLTNVAAGGGASRAAAAPFKRDYPLSPDGNYTRNPSVACAGSIFVDRLLVITEVTVEFLSKCLDAPVSSFECDTSMTDGVSPLRNPQFRVIYGCVLTDCGVITGRARRRFSRDCHVQG